MNTPQAIFGGFCIVAVSVYLGLASENSHAEIEPYDLALIEASLSSIDESLESIDEAFRQWAGLEEKVTNLP